MKVSVLIPVYNAERYIGECLQSIINSDYQDLQILVIDDGSHDKSLSIIKEFAKLDYRIEYFSRENKGIAATRNELLERAIGDAVLYVDSDDWIDPEMVSSLVKILQDDEEVGIAMCRPIKEFSNNTTLSHKTDNVSKLGHEDMIRQYLIHRQITGALWNKLIRKSVIGPAKFPHGIWYGEDAFFVWNVMKNVDALSILDSQLYHYRISDSSISSSGFNEKKMTCIPVWESIISDLHDSHSELEPMAHARLAAELTLLLLDASKLKVSDKDARIGNVRKMLHFESKYLLRDKNYNWKFKGFCLMVQYCFLLTRFSVKYIQ